MSIHSVAAPTARARKVATSLFCLSIIMLWSVSTSAWHQHQPALAHAFTAVGIVLAVVGALGRLWCASHISGNKNQTLVTCGPYSLMRNPLYFFSFIGGLGIALVSETLTITALFCAWFLWYHRAVIAAEEAYLQQVHGEQFQQYARQVPRFWPLFSGYVEAQRWEFSPQAFRRALSEVIWFAVLAIGLHALHDISQRSTPAWIVLY